MKIVYLDASTMGATPMDEIMALGEYIPYATSTKEESMERVRDCEVIMTNKVVVDDELMEAAKNLKLICVCATGVNNIDLEAAKRRGIPVRNVAGYSTDSVVQATFTLLLSLLGRSDYFDNYVKDGSYSASGMFTNPRYPFMELAGKTLGVVGMGSIGSKVASVASAFGMKVIYFSTSGTGHNTDYPSLTLEEVLARADVLSIHAPLNERTRNLIGERELSLMKPSAVVINAGRGGIIDEAALAEAVDTGIIAGAGLDVFETEPVPSDNPLLKVKHPERFRFTPHTAWASQESQLRLVHLVAENIRQGW